MILAGTDLAARRIDQPALYRCTACELDWSYEVVQHIARCPTCGGGLLRGVRARDEGPDYSLATPRARRISASRSRSAGSASSGA